MMLTKTEYEIAMLLLPEHPTIAQVEAVIHKIMALRPDHAILHLRVEGEVDDEDQEG
jgi:hypothetical protein